MSAPERQSADLVDAMRLAEAADEMFWEIRSALAGHDWFDCWASINEAAALATKTILAAGPRLACYAPSPEHSDGADDER